MRSILPLTASGSKIQQGTCELADIIFRLLPVDVYKRQLPGMSDEETADMFGGGEENWTEDKQFFIGRIFHVNLYGGEYNMYTTCSEDGIVEAVSVWIVSGERAVTDEETETWVGRVTELMGTEPVFDGESSEAGSQNWKWNADGFAAAIYRMEDTLSLYFQPAVGELK